jgi:hypothetical protein
MEFNLRYVLLSSSIINLLITSNLLAYPLRLVGFFFLRILPQNSVKPVKNIAQSLKYFVTYFWCAIRLFKPTNWNTINFLFSEITS